MTSRERVITALRHEEPDRVPIDFGATRVTGIMAMAYNRLKEHLGIAGSKTKMYDLMQQLALPEREVIERLGGDVVQIIRSRPFANIPILKWKDGELPDGTPCEVPIDFNPVLTDDGTLQIRENGKVLAHKPATAIYYELADFSLQNSETMEDIETYEFPDITAEELDFVKEQVSYWKRNSEFALMGTFGTTIYEQGAQKVFGFQNFMENLILRRDLIERWMDIQMQGVIKFLDIYLDAVGDDIDIIQFNEDLGAQAGPQISPQLFREILKPRYEKIFEFVKQKKSHLFIFLHSCGSVRDLIPDFIDVGVDVLNPIQTSAKGMDPMELKREFGKNLAFWGGGIDTQNVFPFGTAEDVKKQVRERLRIFAPGGGYVFNQIHNIQADVPAENIAAMFDAALEFGKYPID